jgi:hypothetical protein
MADQRTKAEVLASAREMLARAKDAAAELASKDPLKRRPAIMNLAVYGRAVTNVIEGLRSIEPDFDEWYKPQTSLMREDPLMRFFYKLRTEILKKGQLEVSTSTYVGYMDGAVIQRLMASAPPGTESMVFGDQTGGNGWDVRLPDGSLERVYFEMPEDIDISSTLTFNDPPREHEGTPLKDVSIENLALLYCDALERFVNEAIERFKD